MGLNDGKHAACECPDADGIARYFDAKVPGTSASGPAEPLHPISQRLLEALLARRPTTHSVLELGCGRGGLLLELATNGAARVTGVDLSPAAARHSERVFDAAGVAERARFHVGDAARMALDRHDWVVLDRVICCYADVDMLLSNTIPAAAALYAFTVPTSRGWRGRLARFERHVEMAWNRLRGQPLRSFVHDLDVIERRLTDAGFRLTHTDRHRLWYLAIFER